MIAARLGTLLLLVGGWLLPGCSEEIVVEVTVTGASGEVRSLEVRAALDGRAQDMAAFPVAQDLSRFRVALPASTRGSLTLRVAGLKDNGCAVARGEGTVLLDDQAAIPEVTVALSPVESSCLVTVRKEGIGFGLLTSEPAGISCRAAAMLTGACQAEFAAGTEVTIRAAPIDASELAGWSGACAGAGPCRVTVGERSADVVARIAPPRLCSRDGLCHEQTPLSPAPATQFRRLAGVAPDDVWAAVMVWGYTDFRVLLHWNGTFWAPVDTGSERLQGYVALWASGPQQVWVGGNGTLLRYDGQRWEEMWTGPPVSFTGLWGSGRDDVWAAGSQGIWRWDGTVWSKVPAPAINNTTLFGLGRDLVFAVGDGGAILRWDGAAWQREAGVPTSRHLLAVWGSAPDRVWVAGLAGTLLRWDGAAWTALPSGTTEDLFAIAGAGPDRVWVAGGTTASPRGVILQGDGVTFASVAAPARSQQALWAGGPGDVWAAGISGAVHWDGRTWGADASYNGDGGIWGSAPDDLWLLAVRDGGGSTILHWDGVRWDVTFRGPTVLTDIGGAGRDRVWAVGPGGRVLRWEPGEQRWREIRNGPEPLRVIWAAGPTDVWIGDNGHLLHGDGDRSWVGVDLGLADAITGIWGSGPDAVWVTTYTGAILRKVPGEVRWQVEVAPAAGRNFSGISGQDEREVWVAGSEVWRFDGSGWRSDSKPQGGTGGSLSGIALSGPADVWCGYNNGNVFHREGQAWRSHDIGSANGLLRLFSTGPGRLLVLGEYGTVLSRRP